jgi:uncharacterized protein (DUF885 family)
MNFRMLSLVCALVVTSLVAFAETELEKLDALLKADWEYSMKEFPGFAAFTGHPGTHDRWTDNSREAVERRGEYTRELLMKIDAVDRSELDDASRLNFDLFRKETALQVAGLEFKDETMPVDQLSGIQQSLASTIARYPRRDKKDYETLVSLLEKAGTRIDQEVGQMRWGLELGFTPPAITMRDIPGQVQNQIFDDAMDSPVLLPFKDMPDSIPATEQERLRAAAVKAYENNVRPSFKKMHTFMLNEYLPGARDTIAMSDMENGAKWYAHNVKVRTTTDMTPKEIHELGLSEVKRIRAEMDTVIKSTGFKGSFAEFCGFLQTDPQFYYTNAEDLLRGYRDIAKRIDPELTKLFGILPRNPYGVIPVPSYAEKSQTTAYYMSGSVKAERPGYFFANTYALDTRPTWEMEALTVHEAVPGHHLQISIAQELEEVPDFRRWGGYTAFVEGWGLYSESLGGELGLYTDPYSKFGQLTYEIWRAVRLVVDTGIHAFGWTRQEAIDFFAANSSKQLHDITVEIDRYIVWPGQALAYKIGELKFKELRARATKELGDKFDIRTFHDACLENGALPIDVLDAYIDEWIEEQKAV